jgi:lysophospholipase L1-like esterase
VHIEVNARGLRGPELPDARTPGTLRILWLGDSVTFGYGVERVVETFPYRVAETLGTQLGRPFESVSAGVGGYAPWQEQIWLEREGWGYAPDLVVVGFVLNDLTEPLSLIRYGGQGEGWQLARTARGTLDRWLSSSALVGVLRGGFARLRFGGDVVQGANELEAYDVRRLVAAPDAELWQRSWRSAEVSLAAIFRGARQRGVSAALVIFPYAFQLEAPEQLAAVQRRIAGVARAEGVPVLDLLPALAARREPGLFLDASHPSPEGHAVAAELIAEFLAREALPKPAGAAREG